MSSSPVFNPKIPYVGKVEGGLFPGKIVKVQGKVPPMAVWFAINFQLGPNINPPDAIAIHVSPRFREGFITRNHMKSKKWGQAKNKGPLWLTPGQEFLITISCEKACYKIAINGRHFTEFPHRLPFNKVSHLVIDGDVEIVSVIYKSGSTGAPQYPSAAVMTDVPAANVRPPGPGGLYPTFGPQEPVEPRGGHESPERYGPPADAYGGSGGHNPSKPHDYQPGYEKPKEKESEGWAEVGLVLGAGLLAVGGVAAMYAMNKNKEQEEERLRAEARRIELEKKASSGGLGMTSFGSALVNSLAASALQDYNRSHPSTGYSPQDSNSGSGVLESIIDAFGGGRECSGGRQPYGRQQSGGNDGFSGMLGSILGEFLGGGVNQLSDDQPGHQLSGGDPSNPGSDTSNFLSGLGAAFFSSAPDGSSKYGKNESNEK